MRGQCQGKVVRPQGRPQRQLRCLFSNAGSSNQDYVQSYSISSSISMPIFSLNRIPNTRVRFSSARALINLDKN